MSKIEIHYINPEELIQAEYNPRKISNSDFEHLKDSIKRFGFVDPLIANEHPERKNILIGGHQRLKGAKVLNVNKVPVVYVNLPLEKERELNVRLNKNTGEFDEELLKEFFSADELEDWGFDDLEFFEGEGEEGEEGEYDDTPPVDPISKLGDLYELHSLDSGIIHRVQCGDSTDADVVSKTMDGNISEICFTSPPYNLGKNISLSTNGNRENAYLKYNDNKENSEYLDLLYGFMDLSIHGNEYTFVNIQSLAGNKIAIIDFLYKYRRFFCDVMIWTKPNPQPAMAKNVLNSAFEFIYIFSKNEIPSRAIDTGDFRGTVSNVFVSPVNSSNNSSSIHSATFPLSLPLFFAENFSTKSVYDPFLGSGTTLIAAEQLGRVCYGQELDEKYIDVIVRRWIKYMRDNNKRFAVSRNGAMLSDSEVEDYEKTN